MDVEGVEAGAALVEGLEHDELGGVQQLDGFALAEALGRTVVMQPGTPQRFVRINVADAAHHGLVEERPLHRAAARSQGRRNAVGIELKPSYWRTAVDNLTRLEADMSAPSLFDLEAR